MALGAPASGVDAGRVVPPEPIAGAAWSVVVFSDVACPWATVVVVRLHEARAALGLDDDVAIVHLAHPLEVLNDRPLSRRVIDAEIPLCASLTPQFGWSLWQSRLDEYPVTSLLAAQAVQAARRQSERAAEQLDLALRHAFFVRSRCISVHGEIRAAAMTCDELDATRLFSDLADGASHEAVMRQSAAAMAGAASCSGYIVLPDGSGHCNPGVKTRWIGRIPHGTPVLQADDPDVYRRLVAAAAATPASDAGATCELLRGNHDPQEEKADGDHCGC